MMRKLKDKKNPEMDMNFSVELSYDRNTGLNIDSETEKIEYEIDLSIPDLRIYLTSESIGFMSVKTRKWISVLTEVIKSLIGQTPNFKVSKLGANRTDIQIRCKNKSLFRKPNQKHSITLPAKEYRNGDFKNMEDLVKKVLFLRYLDGNPQFFLE